MIQLPFDMALCKTEANQGPRGRAHIAANEPRRFSERNQQ
jgi:hypothetical protein